MLIGLPRTNIILILVQAAPSVRKNLPTWLHEAGAGQCAMLSGGCEQFDGHVRQARCPQLLQQS